jgi:hypothetical protein
LSRIMASQHETGLQTLDAPLQELILDVTALKLAIQQRKVVLVQYTAKVNDRRTKDVVLEKMKARDDLSEHQDKFFELEKEVKVLDAEIKIQQTHVDTVSKRLERDAERFRHGFHDKMRATMEAYHLSQMEYAEKNSKAWQEMLPGLADGALDTTAAASGPAKDADLLQLKVSVSMTGAHASFEPVGMDNAVVEEAPSPLSSSPQRGGPPRSAFLQHSLPPSDEPPALFAEDLLAPPADEPPAPPQEEPPVPPPEEPPVPPPEEPPAPAQEVEEESPVPPPEEPPAPTQEVEEES